MDKSTEGVLEMSEHALCGERMLNVFEDTFFALKAVGEAYKNIEGIRQVNDIYTDGIGQKSAMEDLGRIAAELSGGLAGALDAPGDSGVKVQFWLKGQPMEQPGEIEFGRTG